MNELIKRDLPYIIAIILCLAAIWYTTQHVSDGIKACNDYWQEQWESQCKVLPGYYNFSEVVKYVAPNQGDDSPGQG